MFQAALTVHDIDADSAMGTSIITDDKCSCRFSDDEEVSECVYVYHNATIVQKQIIFVLWSSSVHMHNIESISVAEKILQWSLS